MAVGLYLARHPRLRTETPTFTRRCHQVFFKDSLLPKNRKKSHMNIWERNFECGCYIITEPTVLTYFFLHTEIITSVSYKMELVIL